MGQSVVHGQERPAAAGALHAVAARDRCRPRDASSRPRRAATGDGWTLLELTIVLALGA